MISISLDTHILSIQPNKKQRDPTKQIIIPTNAVPDVFPLSLENNSGHENFEMFDSINKSYFLLYIKYENSKKGYINSNERFENIKRPI